MEGEEGEEEGWHKQTMQATVLNDHPPWGHGEEDMLAQPHLL